MEEPRLGIIQFPHPFSPSGPLSGKEYQMFLLLTLRYTCHVLTQGRKHLLYSIPSEKAQSLLHTPLMGSMEM
ncbi:unnamed protein product [Caretta caretta]